jgi:hypothetical protein
MRFPDDVTPLQYDRISRGTIWQWTTKSDDEEADEQPKNKQPRAIPWPYRLQALDLQNRFHFQAREVARKTLDIASLRDMKVTVPSLSDQRSAIRKVVRAFAWIDRIALENH